MEKTRRLRDQAAHCIRLSHGIGNLEDVASFEALAAKLDKAAATREAELARLAGRPVSVV